AFAGGSHCRWAVRAIQKYGVVPMVDYPELGVNLSVNDVERCIDYGYNGVPSGLTPIGQQHLVIEYIKIASYEEARDAIANGCPIVIGSNVGFGNKAVAMRDAEGFLSPPTSF